MNFSTIERILLGIAVTVTCTFIFSACESGSSNIPEYAFVDGKSDLVEPRNDYAMSSKGKDIVIPQINEALDKNKDKKSDSTVLPDDKNQIQVVDINNTEEKSPQIMDGGSTYTVRKNDSLWSISMIYGVPMDYLAEINDMKKDDVLPVGKVLVIPPNVKNAVNKPIPAKKETKKVENTVSTSKKPATATSNSVKKNADGSLTYVVKRGDTLGGIALRNHVKLANLAAANKIDVDGILQIGQTLIIPASGAAVAQTTAKSTDNAQKTTTTTKPATETKTSAATTSTTTTNPATTAKQPESKAEEKDAKSTESTPTSSVNNENSDPDVVTIDFTVEREVVFKDYVKSLNLNVEDVLRYNKGFNENSVLPAGTRILIPFN